jgi:hypothetical protein
VPTGTWLGGCTVTTAQELPASLAALDSVMARMQVAEGERVGLPPPVGELAQQCVNIGHQLFFIA